MWTRKELKDKAKTSFKANYWKSVLVALFTLVLVGGMGGFSSVSHGPVAELPSTAAVAPGSSDNVDVEIRDGKLKVDVDGEDGGGVHVDMDYDDIEDLEDALDALEDIGIDVDANGIGAVSAGFWPGLAVAGFTLFLAALAAAAIVVVLYVFALSPLEAGAARFFVRNLNQPAEVREVAFGYDNNYKETVKTLFLRSLFVFLWSLLFVVPGIYKAYQYRMIPYLLAEDPAMTKNRAFAESKRMMDGQKWNAFVLDLSFLGWNILSMLTLGILGAFYVAPYQAQTNAALYEKLRYVLPAPDRAAQPQPVPPAYGASGRAAWADQVGQAAQAGQATQGAAPVIVSEAHPPVPPFAQVGAQPASAAPSDVATRQVPSPDAASPETPSPETPSPDAPSPEAPSPDAPSPDAPSPDAPSPEAPSPDAPSPEAAEDDSPGTVQA